MNQLAEALKQMMGEQVNSTRSLIVSSLLFCSTFSVLFSSQTAVKFYITFTSPVLVIRGFLNLFLHILTNIYRLEFFFNSLSLTAYHTLGRAEQPKDPEAVRLHCRFLNKRQFFKIQHSFLSCFYIRSPDISPERLHKPLSVPEPDVIVIDADDQKKRMESYPRMDTAEGKQASSMLRMLASAGNGKSHRFFFCIFKTSETGFK